LHYYLLLFFAIYLYGQSSESKYEKLALEISAIMRDYNPEDPISFSKAASRYIILLEKDVYREIDEGELEETIGKKYGENYLKYAYLNELLNQFFVKINKLPVNRINELWSILRKYEPFSPISLVEIRPEIINYLNNLPSNIITVKQKGGKLQFENLDLYFKYIYLIGLMYELSYADNHKIMTSIDSLTRNLCNIMKRSESEDEIARDILEDFVSLVNKSNYNIIKDGRYVNEMKKVCPEGYKKLIVLLAQSFDYNYDTRDSFFLALTKKAGDIIKDYESEIITLDEAVSGYYKLFKKNANRNILEEEFSRKMKFFLPEYFWTHNLIIEECKYNLWESASNELVLSNEWDEHIIEKCNNRSDTKQNSLIDGADSIVVEVVEILKKYEFDKPLTLIAVIPKFNKICHELCELGVSRNQLEILMVNKGVYKKYLMVLQLSSLVDLPPFSEVNVIAEKLSINQDEKEKLKAIYLNEKGNIDGIILSKRRIEQLDAEINLTRRFENALKFKLYLDNSKKCQDDGDVENPSIHLKGTYTEDEITSEALQIGSEMCIIMEKYDYENPSSALDIIDDLQELSEKPILKNVPESMMMAVMKENCIEGLRKYIELTSQ
jgi:hypothetical protein